VSLRVVREFRQKFGYKVATFKKEAEKERPSWRMYEQDFKDAWDITEELLLRFRDAVEKDGAKFVLVNVAGRKLDMKIQEGIEASPFCDQTYINTRLEAFSKANGIRFLSLIPYFKKYAAEYRLQYTDFFPPCDTHWNPLGHKVATEVVANYLVQEGLLPKELTAHEVSPKALVTGN
jgi:hypothetical protein